MNNMEKQLKFKVGDRVVLLVVDDDYFGNYLGEITEIDYVDYKKPYLVEIINNSMDEEIGTGVFIWCSERVLERGWNNAGNHTIKF